MEEKGGTLVVRLQEVNLTGNNKPVIHALPPGKYLKLEVSDNGSGIDKKIINHIFDPYYTTKPKGKGSGLGLAVAYGIVKDHGGTIKVESKLGHGATFKVLLPVIDRVDNNNKPDMKSPNKPPKGTERILFVDDEKSMAVLGQKMLKTLGYTVRYETNSNTALETFRDNPQDFDLVITDQIMPDLSGSELSKELMKIRPDLPIILYSGYSSVISERETRILGIKAFVMKPMDLLKLAQTVRKVLDKEWSSGQHF
jgi:CheY-like chemotaxis protein